MKAVAPRMRSQARRLRQDQTEAERRLWLFLRDRQIEGAKFRRQQVLGRFVVDFCCMEVGLIVELDGGQHTERVEEDRERTLFLEREGFRVVRYWNHEVLQATDAVLESIRAEILACRVEGRRYGGTREPPK